MPESPCGADSVFVSPRRRGLVIRPLAGGSAADAGAAGRPRFAVLRARRRASPPRLPGVARPRGFRSHAGRRPLLPPARCVGLAPSTAAAVPGPAASTRPGAVLRIRDAIGAARAYAAVRKSRERRECRPPVARVGAVAAAPAVAAVAAGPPARRAVRFRAARRVLLRQQGQVLLQEQRQVLLQQQRQVLRAPTRALLAPR